MGRSEKERPHGQADPNVVTEAVHPTIPPGDYEAICYKAEYGISFGGRKDLYVLFRISEGDFKGTELFMAICPPKKLTQRTKKWQQWALSIGRHPQKGERFSKSIFEHKMFKILVRQTKSKFDNGQLKPDFMQYSVVDTILDVLTGVPVR